MYHPDSVKHTINRHCPVTHLVLAGHIGHTSVLPSQLVLDLVHSIVLNVNGTNQQIVGDVVKVTTEFQPGPGSTDVVSGALSLHLQQQTETEEEQQEIQRIRERRI